MKKTSAFLLFFLFFFVYIQSSFAEDHIGIEVFCKNNNANGDIGIVEIKSGDNYILEKDSYNGISQTINFNGKNGEVALYRTSSKGETVYFYIDYVKESELVTNDQGYVIDVKTFPEENIDCIAKPVFKASFLTNGALSVNYGTMVADDDAITGKELYINIPKSILDKIKKDRTVNGFLEISESIADALKKPSTITVSLLKNNGREEKIHETVSNGFAETINLRSYFKKDKGLRNNFALKITNTNNKARMRGFLCIESKSGKFFIKPSRTLTKNFTVPVPLEGKINLSNNTPKKVYVNYVIDNFSKKVDVHDWMGVYLGEDVKIESNGTIVGKITLKKFESKSIDVNELKLASSNDTNSIIYVNTNRNTNLITASMSFDDGSSPLNLRNSNGKNLYKQMSNYKTKIVGKSMYIPYGTLNGEYEGYINHVKIVNIGGSGRIDGYSEYDPINQKSPLIFNSESMASFYHDWYGLFYFKSTNDIMVIYKACVWDVDDVQPGVRPFICFYKYGEVSGTNRTF